MPYSDLAAKSDTDTIDLTDWNTLKDNWDASAVDAMAAKGDLPVGTGADALARLAAGSAGDELTPDAGETTGLKWQIRPAVHLTKSGSISSATASSWTAIEFDTETEDTNGMHEGVTNPTRITIPTNGDGWYNVGGYVIPSGQSPNQMALRIRLGGSTVLVGNTVRAYSPAPLAVSVSYPFSATNYIELEYYAYQSGMSIAADAVFWAVYQRPN